MIKGYIFDYGGTLDSAGCHWGKMLWHAYERQQVPVTWDEFKEAYIYAERYLSANPIIKPDYTFKRTLEVKLRLEMEYLCTQGYWNAGEEELRRVHSTVLNHLYSQVVAITTHSREVLEVLHRTCPMVLVTNFYGNMHSVLREFGFTPFFSKVIESSVVGIRKPDSRIFTLGVEALGLQPDEVMVVGDSFYKDVEPALKAGCHAVWFKGEGWYDQTYDETVPDKVITDMAQLLPQQ